MSAAISLGILFLLLNTKKAPPSERLLEYHEAKLNTTTNTHGNKSVY